MSTPPRFLRNQAGSTAVEFALIAIPLLLMVFGILEAGRATWMRSTLQEAAAAAARCYAVDATTCASIPQVQAYAISQAHGMTLSASQVSASAQPCGRRVVITVPFDSVVPELIPWDFNLSADACFR